MINQDQVVIDLLEALADAWTEQLTVSEIGSDPDKIRLLLRAKDSLETKPAVLPTGVRALYEGVFKRHVWDSC